ncbi:MAG: TonB-dependent receptor plug domain-containing protein, partial [Chitinophagaceae bacterium]|nr:TonB-dependent receptor plug domain-containing protein [Chitinophagaceae bacterium]
MNRIIYPKRRVLKKIAVSIVLLFVFMGSINSQVPVATVTGTVISENGNILLAGVNVEAKQSGTSEILKSVTNEKGIFSFTQIKQDKFYDFTFSYVGYANTFLKQFKIVSGQNNSILIKMKTSENHLNEVIVTALGIKREEKSLGYAAQSVTENDVKDAKTNNWVNSLSGKVAGLNIQGTGSGPMGSSRITLRGENSLNLDNNQALIVIDGVPVSSKITGTGYKAHLAQDSPVDFGSDLSDINPDDIANVTVLKGPGATALYGSRAAGGALIITTKTGARKDKGLGIT